ncbi:DUF4148 domain-containing protein [Paraburkholderia aspalathi]
MLALVSALVATPTLSFAQTGSHSSPTRAQVRQELVDLESVGYDPSRGDDADYPEDILNAKQRLARNHKDTKQKCVLARAETN